MKRMMRYLYIIFLLILPVFVLFQYTSLYPVLFSNKEPFIKESKDIQVNYLTVEGNKIKTIYIEGKKEYPVVIYFHGNHELIDHNVIYLKNMLHKDGIGVLLVEYNGYGNSEGLPTLKRTNKAVLDALSFYKLNDKDIVVFGRSIGTAHAYDFVFNHSEIVSKLIILSGFISPVNIIETDHGRASKLDLLMFFNYNMENKIKDYTATKNIDTLLLHGKNDGMFNVDVVPHMADILNKKRFITETIIFNGTHNNINIKKIDILKFIFGNKRYNDIKEEEMKYLNNLSIIRNFKTYFIKP